MAAKRLPMRRLREILRLKYEAGLSHRAIARACSVGLGTVARTLERADEVGLTWPLPGEVKELARALRERIRLAPLLERDAERRVFLRVQEGRRGRDRGRGADRRVAGALEQPRDYAGEKLFLGVRTHWSR